MNEEKKQRRCVDQEKHPVRRMHKDRLFRLVFQDRRDLLSLYNAVNGTDYQNPEDLIVTTLEDAVFLGMKNDLSFIIGATMNLYEHQSTWNANMPLRGLFYFAGLYQIYVEYHGYNLYGSRRIELPFPNYLVFYNGDEKDEEQIELTLAESFQKARENDTPCVDCRVRVLNINRGHNRELLEKCRRLWEYSELIGRIKVNIQAGMEFRDSIRKAMDECRLEGILADLLSRCQTEVFDMLLTEYDEEKVRDYLRREAWGDGWEEGRENGRREGRKIGEKQGRKIGEKQGRELGRANALEQVNRLNRLLIEEGRYEELKRASEDAEFQQTLFAAYGIEP